MLIIQIRIQRDGDIYIYIYIVEEREIQTRTERYRKRYLTSVLLGAAFLWFLGSLDCQQTATRRELPEGDETD